MYEFLANITDLTLIELALQEDLGVPYYDATTALLVDGAPRPRHAKAIVLSKHPSDVVLCGISLLPLIAAKFGGELSVQSSYHDGDIITSGATLMTLQSNAVNLLSLERTILNFLRHLSAIASLTREFVQRINHTQCKIVDTRKTTPGWRHLEKYAVHCGGGGNHRQGLYDAIMIKDTHIDLLGGMQSALAKLPKQKILPVIVEVRDLIELKIAINYRHQIDRILLDNIRGQSLLACLQLCKENNVETEASGNLTLNNVVEIAESGVDYASIGMLTYAAGQVDFSMRIQ